MLIILLLFFLLFPSKILAVDPIITVNPIIASVVAGNQFNLNFSVINSEVGTTFFYKIYGGIDADNYGIKTVKNNIYLPYTGGYSWSSFPFFIVGEGGSASVDGTAVIVSNSPAGNYNVRVSINNTNTISSNNSQTISVSTPPTCTYTYSKGDCTASNTQTLTVSSSTPSGCIGTPITSQNCTYITPVCNYTYSAWIICSSSGIQTRTITTSTPAGCTGTPILSQGCTYISPTKPITTPTIDLNKYSPSPSIEQISPIIEPTDIFETPIPTEESTSTPTPDSGSVLGESSPKKNIIPLIFICLGALFLLTPLIITKIKSKQDA